MDLRSLCIGYGSIGVLLWSCCSQQAQQPCKQWPQLSPASIAIEAMRGALQYSEVPAVVLLVCSVLAVGVVAQGTLQRLALQAVLTKQALAFCQCNGDSAFDH